jgi:hypothetical protein
MGLAFEVRDSSQLTSVCLLRNDDEITKYLLHLEFCVAIEYWVLVVELGVHFYSRWLQQIATYFLEV